LKINNAHRIEMVLQKCILEDTPNKQNKHQIRLLNLTKSVVHLRDFCFV